MAVMQVSGLVWQSSGATFLARISGNLGTPITQATIGSIPCKVIDLAPLPTVVVLSPVVPVSSISDTLIANDPRWLQDAIGYNFLYQMPHTAFPKGSNPYLVQFLFMPVTGEPFPVEYRVDAIEVF